MRFPTRPAWPGTRTPTCCSHAIIDAVLGAIAQGDIGRHFPDTDPRWKGASSLGHARARGAVAAAAGFRVSNVDAVVVAERPKLRRTSTRSRSLAPALGVSLDRVSVKGKTNEGVDAIGRGEAMAVHAVAVLVASERWYTL